MGLSSVDSCGHYTTLLGRVHQTLLPRTYVEIGVHHGKSLALTMPGTLAVGIDPEYDIQRQIASDVRLFRMTSDAFFEQHDLRAVLGGLPLDLAFVDGMHHFEFALRDFISLEPACEEHSTIMFHDCFPVDAATSARERSTSLWSGDIWKLVLCLKEYRPDLVVSAVDVRPTGVGIIRGLDPRSTTLADHYDEMVEKYLPLPFDVLVPGKDQMLNRVTDDWSIIRKLLPGQPLRRGPGPQSKGANGRRYGPAGLRRMAGKGLTRLRSRS